MATSGDLDHEHGATSDETVVAELNGKLLEWQACKTVKEYFDIPYRNPFKKQVQDPVLNRFGGRMGPYEDSLIENIPGVRYINATEYPSGYLPGTSTEFNYIATMCPKLETFEHFWLMVWAKNTRLLLTSPTLRTALVQNLVTRKSDTGLRTEVTRIHQSKVNFGE